MSELEDSGLMYPNMVYRNKDGKIVFSMKRKEGYGSLYYIFEKNEDIMSTHEKEQFAKAFEVIAMGAAYMGFPLYDSKELMDGVTGMTQVLLKSKEGLRAAKKADKTGKTVLVQDIDIKIFNHATGRINNLTVGISIPPGNSEYIEKILVDMNK